MPVSTAYYIVLFMKYFIPANGNILNICILFDEFTMIIILGVEVFGEIRKVVLEENGENKMATKSN